MIEDVIKKDAHVKIFPVRQETKDLSGLESHKLGEGIIRKFVSETEVEIALEEEIALEKKVCYAIYILSYEKVYLSYVYYRSSYYEEGEYIISMDIVSPMERVQRRMYQRVSCHSRLSFRRLPKEEITEELIKNKNQMELHFPVYEDSMIDISGGGIRFTTRKEVKQGDYLYVAFDIEQEGEIVTLNILGQVVYAGKFRNEQDYLDIRMKYIGISEQEKEQIIHFVFQLERNY